MVELSDAVHVIKIDNSTAQNPEELAALAAHIAVCHEAGERLVLVHGGSDELLQWFGKFYGIDGRRTGLPLLSESNIELVSMVLCGAVNQRLVLALRKAGVATLGLSGTDAGMLSSNFLNKRHLGRIGGPPRVDVVPLRKLLDAGFVVVLSSVCPGADGGLMLLDEEVTAQAVATGLEANQLDFLTSVATLDSCDLEGKTLQVSALRELLSGALAGTDLVPKLQAAMSALHDGVHSVSMGSLEQLRESQAYTIAR